MPISLRLPVETESMIADFGARHGLSKTAVIVRSIQEFLAAHARPSSLQIYEQAMRESAVAASAGTVSDLACEDAEKRMRKRAIRDAIGRKHALRSARASQALTRKASTARRGNGKKA